jgi:hypothetical protein
MPLRKENAVYCENHTKYKNALCEQNAEFQYVKWGGTDGNHWNLNG